MSRGKIIIKIQLDRKYMDFFFLFLSFSKKIRKSSRSELVYFYAIFEDECTRKKVNRVRLIDYN